MSATPSEALPAAVLVHEPGRSGGMAVIESHLRALARDGRFAPEVVVTGPLPEQPPKRLGGAPVRPLRYALGNRYEIAIATWWTTAAALFELSARRRIVFLQSLEERFYGERDLFDRLGAAGVLQLPVDFITVASWLRDLLQELRPEARCLLVRNGIDKSAFAARPLPPADGPLRVLVEGQPTLWFKGVAEAAAAVRAMREPARLTLAAPEAAGIADGVAADRREAGLDAPGMASLYAEHHVLLKLSRVESLGLPPLEAMHVGRPCVITPFTGHEEYAEHGRNCLVAGFDDEPGTVALLDLLARDRGLLERLSGGALRTAAGWPGAEEAGNAFCDAVAELHAQPSPAAAAPAGHGRALARQLRLWTESGRHQLDHLRGLLAWRERELADTRRDLGGRIAGLEAKLEAVSQERAYRLARTVRSMVRRRRE